MIITLILYILQELHYPSYKIIWFLQYDFIKSYYYYVCIILSEDKFKVIIIEGYNDEKSIEAIGLFTIPLFNGFLTYPPIYLSLILLDLFGFVDTVKFKND